MKKILILLTTILMATSCIKDEIEIRTFEYKVYNPTYDIQFTYINSDLEVVNEMTEAGVEFRYRGQAIRFEEVGLTTNYPEHTTFTIYYAGEIYERFEDAKHYITLY